MMGPKELHEKLTAYELQILEEYFDFEFGGWGFQIIELGDYDDYEYDEDYVDDFGIIDLDDDYDLPPPIPTDYCGYPDEHEFVEKVNFNLLYNECSKCGYSPQYDGGKKRFFDCHKDYINWLMDGNG